MKTQSLIFREILIAAMMFTSCGRSDLNKPSTSKIEIQFSEKITIGNQVWMTENLNVDKFRNGDPIPEAKTHEEWERAAKSKQPAWCYYGNDHKNKDKYGKLYNWFAVCDPRGLAPLGYHVPSNVEWKILIDFLGGENVAGKKMKSVKNWLENGNENNQSRFSGLPGGWCNTDGTFSDIGSMGYYWSSTELNTANAWFCVLVDNFEHVVNFYIGKELGQSVRCVKD